MSSPSRALLGPGGPLARALHGYEERSGQLEMASAVERALAQGRTLLTEAGTGTGKTLAYLVPAILSGRKVVVSTATKALQEQIFEKDLPLIAQHLGLDPRAALAKGLSNYLCLRRYNEARSTAIADPALMRALPIIDAWARDTETGDVAELPTLAEGDPAFREIASSSDTRIGASCTYYERCFVTRMRRELESARIIVANHHLVFADLAVKAAAETRGYNSAGALPPYDAIIFDEAHELESIATEFFGTRVSRARIAALLRDADRALAMDATPKKRSKKRPPTAVTSVVERAASELFDLLGPLANGEGRVTLSPEVWAGDVASAYHQVDQSLEALVGCAEVRSKDEAMRVTAQRAAQLRIDLGKITDPSVNHVTWIEARSRSVSIGASPIEVGGLFRDRLIEKIGSVIFTSATLTTPAVSTCRSMEDLGGELVSSFSPSPRLEPSFSFFRSRVGLDEAVTVPVDELSVASPFDFKKAAILYTPRDLPEVNDAAFLDRAAERVAELVALTGGGAFVLCTSVRSMRAFASALRGSTPRPPLLQGDGPKLQLLRRFRSEGNAVLCATMSFWEGVDVPGDALRLVIIDRIPFSVPTDPVVLARCRAIEQAGGNPFTSYSVPEAAITLKQGFGRLIRTRTDRGIVAILDRRIRTRGYGTQLLRALPPARRTDRLDDVAAFWTGEP